ncbi:TusE/DsrC/DsvC family sulfur relay protein [Thiocystis violacea]|uniref:TusE/DsrC/DsvC family sulfur relay protein n=1 Tax=Thiocystis violacea TaxID=13725 RepID=UPI0019034FE8|nr:TusE/DsrC/DsvC family sulfur relay protein [Thiocystis violacea]MBK1718168.1 sulfite reductase [Thiocystis violacea]
MATQTMSDIMNPGAINLDPEFPHAPPEWTRGGAEEAAQHDGIQLDEDHWRTIKALQDYFERHDHPNVRDLHDALDESFHSKGGIKYLYGLFPGGPVAQGCRYAGLQPPSGALDKSFGSVQ